MVTLWDMLRFNAHRFVRMIASSAEVQGMNKLGITGHNYEKKMFETQMPDSFINQMPQVLGKLKLDCDESLLLSASDLIEDMLEANRTSGGRITWGEYWKFDGELNKRIEHELKRKKFYQLRPETSHLFDAVLPFGETVQMSFPSASHDIAEAGKCFACERYDATVYHLSRALESPLKCLARTLNIKYTPSWAGYIHKIDKKLKNTKMRLSKKRRTFLGNASALLWGVKEAWRNESAHLGKQYGPDQTKQIFDSTKSFMQHLATELRERVV